MSLILWVLSALKKSGDWIPLDPIHPIVHLDD